MARAFLTLWHKNVHNVRYPCYSVLLDGQPIYFDVQPVIQNGHTLVPFSALAEAFGADAIWSSSTNTVIVILNGETVTLPVGGTTAYVDGNPVTLDVPAEIIDGRTMVPLQFITTALGAEVSWDSATRTITIQSPGQPSSPNSPNVTTPTTSQGGIITTIAGNGKPGYSGDNGPVTSAEFSNPLGVCVDSSGKAGLIPEQRSCRSN